MLVLIIGLVAVPITLAIVKAKFAAEFASIFQEYMLMGLINLAFKGLIDL